MSDLIKTLDEVWQFYEFDKQALIYFFRGDYKHFNKKAKRKEAKKMAEDLDLKRQAVKEIKEMIHHQGIDKYWLPTPENINALPEPVRRLIHLLETNFDPAGIVQENILIKDTCKALVIKLEEKKLKVDQAFVNIWADRYLSKGDVCHLRKQLKLMLKEAGVVVK